MTAAPAVAVPSSSVVEVPISFSVQNTNRTAVPCLSDGKDYTVRGTIVAPESALENPSEATLLLHAVTWGQLRCLTGGDSWAPKGYAAFFKNNRDAFYFDSAEQAVPDVKPDRVIRCCRFRRRWRRMCCC